MTRMAMVQCSPLQSRSPYRNVRGMIFDCDGVMVDSKDANRQYYNSIRSKVGLGPMSPEQEDFVHAHSVHRSLEHILPPDRLDWVRKERPNIDYRQFLASIRLESGLMPLLSELKGRGVLLGVNTNRTDTMDSILETFGLGPFFHPVVTANRVSRAKPHPESLNQILDLWKLAPGEVVYVGDSIVDQETAAAADVPFWAYKNPLLLADLHVADFWTLLQCFRGA